MPDLRRERRVVYHTKVRLRAPGRDDSVVGRVQNLSTNGIYVTAPELPEAGTEVLCRMLVGGERRTFRGLVAWTRPGDDGGRMLIPGAGIRFVDLSRRDAELLGQLMEPDNADSQAVDVWFEGLGSPVRNQAVIFDESLQISTRLSFLRLNSPVRMVFTRRGVEEVRTGTLESVTLEPSTDDGIPRLQLTVSTPVAEAAQGTIEVPHGRHLAVVPPPEDEERTVVDAAVLSGATGAVPIERSDDERTQRVCLDALPPLLAPVLTRASPGTPVLPPPARSSFTPWVGGALVATAVAFGAVWFLRRPPPARNAATVFAMAPVPIKATAESKPFAVHIEPLPALPRASPGDKRLIDVRRTVAEGAEGFRLVADEPARSELTMAFAGNARGFVAYPLANPRGLAVNLPRGRVRVAPGLYAAGGLFRHVLVQRKGAGSHLRVLYDKDQSASAAIDRGTLRIMLSKSQPARDRHYSKRATSVSISK